MKDFSFMKHMFFILFLILASSLVVSAQETKIEPCPKITVTSPKEIVNPGDTMIFSVNVDGVDFQQFSYKWSINKGTIIEGLESQVVSIDTTGIANETIAATVEILGLANGCKNKFEEIGVVAGCGLLFEIGNYDYTNFEEEKIQLQNAKIYLINQPQDSILFIFYYPKNADIKKLEARMKKVSDYLINKLKIPESRFTLILGGESKSYKTIIYPVPEDVDIDSYKNSVK